MDFPSLDQEFLLATALAPNHYRRFRGKQKAGDYDFEQDGDCEGRRATRRIVPSARSTVKTAVSPAG
jgi:hypothetical protein